MFPAGMFFRLALTSSLLSPTIIAAMVFFNGENYQQQQQHNQNQQQRQHRGALAGFSIDYDAINGSPFANTANSFCQSATLDYPPGTVITLQCPQGYELVGADASTCNARGWAGGGIGFCRRSLRFFFLNFFLLKLFFHSHRGFCEAVRGSSHS